MQIKVSEILNDLTNGLTRADIKAKYNLSTAQMKSIFAHPKLKGRKTKQAEQPIELVDDMDEITPTPVSVRIQAELPFDDQTIKNAEEIEETVRPDVEETEEDIFS